MNIGWGKNTRLRWSRTKQRIRNHDSVTLEFNLHFQDNSLSCEDAKEQELNQRQIAIYKLITFMKHERGMSYRKMSKWLNRSGIKTHKGKIWGETGNSVYSVFKQMKERDYRLNTIKKFKTKSEITDFKITEFPLKISKFSLETVTFD